MTAGQCGGVEAVIGVLRREDAVDSLLKEACWALANMTAGDADNQLKKAAGRCGSVEAVIGLLRREGASNSLLEQACWALRNMTAGDADNGLLQENA
jgi:hypothetical protein